MNTVIAMEPLSRPENRRRPRSVVGALILTGFACASHSQPVSELAPGVRLGSERVAVEQVFAREGFYPRALTWATCGGRKVLVAGGRGGAAILGTDGTLVAFVVPVLPPGEHGSWVPIQADDDPGCELMDPGGGWQPVGLWDDTGVLLWRHPRDRSAPAPDAMAAGDLDGDRRPEFVVGSGNGRDLRVLDVRGQERARWKGPNIFSLALLDVDGDGDEEILHSYGVYQKDLGVWLRNGDGTLLRQVTSAFSDVLLTRMPRALDKPALAGLCDGDGDSPPRDGPHDQGDVEAVRARRGGSSRPSVP